MVAKYAFFNASEFMTIDNVLDSQLGGSLVENFVAEKDAKRDIE